MDILKIKLFGLVFIVVGFLSVNAEVDCNERPPHVDFKSCCDFSDLVSDDIKEKCGKEVGPPRGPHGPPSEGHPPGPPGHHKGHHHGPHPCFISCALNETGILVDDEIQEDNLANYLNEVFDDSEKVDFITNKFQQCDELRKNFVPKMSPHKHGHGHGHHGHHHCGKGGMLMFCVFMESFKDCPESNWSNTDECNAAREHFIQCSPHGNNDANDEEELEEVDVEEI